MKLLKKFFKNDEKLNANEVVICTYEENNKYKKLDEYLKNIKPKLLWTNPNPTDKFPAQTISLDLSDYDVIGIVYKNYRTEDYTDIMKFPKGLAAYLNITTVNVSPNDWGTSVRAVTSSDTGLVFANGMYRSITLSSTGYDSSRCVPIYIIGYKIGLSG